MARKSKMYFFLLSPLFPRWELLNLKLQLKKLGDLLCLQKALAIQYLKIHSDVFSRWVTMTLGGQVCHQSKNSSISWAIFFFCHEAAILSSPDIKYYCSIVSPLSSNFHFTWNLFAISLCSKVWIWLEYVIDHETCYLFNYCTIIKKNDDVLRLPLFHRK